VRRPCMQFLFRHRTGAARCDINRMGAARWSRNYVSGWHRGDASKPQRKAAARGVELTPRSNDGRGVDGWWPNLRDWPPKKPMIGQADVNNIHRRWQMVTRCNDVKQTEVQLAVSSRESVMDAKVEIWLQATTDYDWNKHRNVEVSVHRNTNDEKVKRS